MERNVWTCRATIGCTFICGRKKGRKQLTGMLNRGRESARVLRRASILRQLDQGQTAAQVADHVGVAPKTVRAIARR